MLRNFVTALTCKAYIFNSYSLLGTCYSKNMNYDEFHFQIYVTLTNRVLTIDNVGKDVCLFLDSYKETAANTITRTITDRGK